MRGRTLDIALTVILVIVALGFGACGGESGGDQNTAVISAINILDTAGLHDIETSINEKGEIPASARTTALKMQTVVALTEWPGELEQEANALGAILAEMAKALDGDKPDVKAAGAAAKKAHDAEHDFSGKVWEHLMEEAGIAGRTAPHKD